MANCNRTTALIVVALAIDLTGCGDGQPAAALVTRPSPVVVTAPALITFTEPGTGFSTTELRDAQEQVLQINTANELIWTADGTHLPGYRVDRCCYPGVSFIVGRICPEGCAFEVRFGGRDGDRRAYLTVDYGHDNPGTLVDVEVSGGALVVSRTNLYVPGSYTLSGVVTEATSEGLVPVAGVLVYRGVVSGWRSATTDINGFYSLQGMFDGLETVVTSKDGYVRAEDKNVLINGNTRFDIQVVRQ